MESKGPEKPRLLVGRLAVWLRPSFPDLPGRRHMVPAPGPLLSLEQEQMMVKLMTATITGH